MPKTQVEEIAVTSLTKFGFADANGKYVNYSRNCKDEDKLKVVPGVKFSAEIYVANSGTRYLNKVFKLLQAADPVKKVTEKPVVNEIPVTAKNERAAEILIEQGLKNKETMTKAEWNAKGRSQLIGGVSHDAAELVAAMLSMQPAESITSVLDIYKEILVGLLKIRDEVK